MAPLSAPVILVTTTATTAAVPCPLAASRIHSPVHRRVAGRGTRVAPSSRAVTADRTNQSPLARTADNRLAASCASRICTSFHGERLHVAGRGSAVAFAAAAAAAAAAAGSADPRGRRTSERVSAPWKPLRVLAGMGRGGMPTPPPMPTPMPRQQQQGTVIKLILCGPVSSDFGRAAVSALTSARGVSVAAVVDATAGVQGRDVGELAGLPEPLELPVMSDVIMVLASVAQSRCTGVYVDFTGNAAAACENVRQATAFGLSSVVVGASIPDDDVSTLFEFCDKASTGCIIAPNLSIASVLLERAAAQFAFHCTHAHIVESHAQHTQTPSEDALRLANQLAQIGRTFNGNDASDSPARGALFGEGVRVHSLQQPGGISSMDVRFAAKGQLASLRVDITSQEAFIPGLLLAIRRVPRLKGLIYGLEKLL